VVGVAVTAALVAYPALAFLAKRFPVWGLPALALIRAIQIWFVVTILAFFLGKLGLIPMEVSYFLWGK
jgi:hypothetical protein